MLAFEEAKKVILECAKPTGTETISVREALGRVLANPLKAPCDVPGARISAVDGYAVKLGGGMEFREIGFIAPGELPSFAIAPGQCAAVMTGGVVPEGADCVVMVEDTEAGGGVVNVHGKPERGAFINETGSEAKAGTEFVALGTRIDKAVYPVLFYAGIPEVTVFRRPRIGVLVTGGELREVEEGPRAGTVFNTNEYTLTSFLHSLGLACDRRIRVGEDERATREGLDELAAACDVVVSSGGVSMGRHDHCKKIFNEKAFRLLVNGTAIKPGHPLMFAERDGKLFFGMPGYPAAFLTNAVLYLVPALKKAAGLKNYEHRWIGARLAASMRSRRGRLDFNRAVLELENGAWIARDLPSQKTSRFLDFARVNGLVMMPEETGSLEAGATVRALHFDLELCGSGD